MKHLIFLVFVSLVGCKDKSAATSTVDASAPAASVSAAPEGAEDVTRPLIGNECRSNTDCNGKGFCEKKLNRIVGTCKAYTR